MCHDKNRYCKKINTWVSMDIEGKDEEQDKSKYQQQSWPVAVLIPVGSVVCIKEWFDSVVTDT